MDTQKINDNPNILKQYLSPIQVWALSLGCAVGWGSFIMPGTTFLPKAGPLGTALGLILGAVVMYIIGVNYYYLIVKYPKTGGTLTYTINTFGYDHGFLSAWFLILVYIAIIWANATALALISKNLLGSTFQFGFYYQILGYDVYFGEVLLSIVAVLICGILCIKNKKMAAWVQVLLACALMLGIIIVAVFVHVKNGGGHSIPRPYFSNNGGSTFRQIFTIIALSPWAFVGFESISNSAEGFKFKPGKNVIVILAVALLSAAAAYVLLAQIAVATLPEGYTDWQSYLADIGNLPGVAGIPTFNATYYALGNLGVIILGVAAFAGIMTGLIGNFIAASRLIYAMAEEGMFPKQFGVLNKNRVPQNALLFLVAISVVIPFLGRTAIGWIIDVNTIGATIAYAYTSAAAFVNARKDGKKIVQITGVIGVLMSLLFFLYFMVLAAGAMSTESYLILASWSILGFFYFRVVYERDRERRFGHSTVVWISMLFLIFFTSLVWVRNATNDMTAVAIRNISSFYESQSAGKDPATIRITEQYIKNQLASVDRNIIRNSIIQMALNIISLSIMFNIYSIMANREKNAEIETTKAYERSRAKTVFLSNMSHDIRTPMNAIIGYINLAEDENVTMEELRDYLGKIKGSSNHLLALINDVLEMSRIESGKMELEPVPVDLKEVFIELKDLFTTQMSEKKIEYSVTCSDISDPYVYCDKNRLNRILLNLVSNAYKFTPEGGSVRVYARQMGSDRDKNRYEIRVADSGIGMSKEFAAKVFEAFEREKNETVKQTQGTGLGMSIVKNLVEMMDGNTTVNTEPGKGTEFVVTILLKKLEEENISALVGLEEEKNRKKETVIDFTTKRLLLTDDIVVNRTIAKKLLEKNGFKVEEAENGQEAVNMLTGSEPGYYDAILMDIQMPVMDGYEATRYIRELDDDRKNIPIIAMTANAFSEDIRKADEAGMNAHVAKPIDVKKLKDVLTEVLFGDEKT